MDDATRDQVLEHLASILEQVQGVRADMIDVKARLQRVELTARNTGAGELAPQPGSWPTPSWGARAYLRSTSTTRSVTASRIRARTTSSFGCRSAKAPTIILLPRGTPSASSARIAGATRATMAAVSAEDG